MTTTARQFLDEVADIIRAKGRVVTIEESPLTFGTFAWLNVEKTHWYDTGMNLSAAYNDRTKRWSLGTMNVYPTTGTFTRKTRSAIKIAAGVYA